MANLKLTKLELKVMDAVWRLGSCSVREIQEAFAEAKRPAFTTVQTVVYRLEKKGALRCVKRIANANIFEAAMTREEAQRGVVSDLLGLFDGRAKLLMAHLIQSGELTLEDVREAEEVLKSSEPAGQQVSQLAEQEAEGRRG